MPAKNSFNMLRQLRLQVKTGYIRRELPEYEFMRRYPPLNRDTATAYKKIDGRQLPYMKLYEKALSRNPLYLDERVYPAYWKEEPEAIVLARKQYNYMTADGLDENSAYEKALKDIQEMESKSYEDFLSLMKVMKEKGVGSLITQNQDLNSKIEKYTKLLEETPYYSLKLADQGEIDYIIQVDMLKWGELQRERRMRDPIFAARFDELRTIVFPKIEKDLLDLFESKQHKNEYKLRFKHYQGDERKKNYLSFKEKFFVEDYVHFYNKLVNKDINSWKETEKNAFNSWILNTLAMKEVVGECSHDEKADYLDIVKKAYFPASSSSDKAMLTVDHVKSKLFQNDIGYKKDGDKLHVGRHYRIPAVLWPSEVTKLRFHEIIKDAEANERGSKPESKNEENKEASELHEIFREASTSESSRSEVISQLRKSNRINTVTPVDIKSMDALVRDSTSMTQEEQRLKSMQHVKKVTKVNEVKVEVDPGNDQKADELTQFEAEMLADPNTLLQIYDKIDNAVAEPLLDQDDLVSDKDLSAEDIHNVKELVSVLNNDEDDSDDFESSKSKDPVFLQMLEQYKPKTVLEKHRHSMLSVTEEYRLEDCTDLDELESFTRQRLDSSIVTRARLSTRYEQKEGARRAREWRQRGVILEELPPPALNIAKKNNI